MKINLTISAIAIVFITGLIISCSLNPAEEDPKPIIVNFPDPNLEALIREKLEIPTGNITNHDMWTITYLYGDNKNIHDISGIEYCSGLRILALRGNDIINIEPLSKLVLLNNIALENNQISDIKPFVDNPGIGIGDDILTLFNNPLSDKTILQYIPMIQARGVKIYSDAILSSPGIVNIIDENFRIVIREHLNKPTGDIINTELDTITKIYARNRNIENIYGIEFCLNLNTLDIGENSISDLVPLITLNKLSILKADNNIISYMEPFLWLGGLTNLYLNNNTLPSIDVLSHLKYLTTLFLNNTTIQDISPLSNLLNLRYLTLSGNPIDNFEPIGNIDSLNTLELVNLNQFDFSDIKDISNLQTLYLTNTPVVNLDSIANITSLQNLIMTNCSLSNIDSLANLNKLAKLLLNYNIIVDITSLTELHELYELNLENNYISDILPLVNNWGIGGGDYVLLYNNPLSDISINTYIPQLIDRGVNVIY